MMWSVLACMHAGKEVFINFIHVILGSMREPLVHCFYTLPLRDHTIVKLLCNLKKHALQDGTKVLRV